MQLVAMIAGAVLAGAVFAQSGADVDGKGHPKISASDAEIKAAVEYVLSR